MKVMTEEEFDRLLVCRTDDVKADRAQHDFGLDYRETRFTFFLQVLDEFIGPEQVYFFVRLTLAQLDALRASTDCISARGSFSSVRPAVSARLTMLPVI